MRLVVAVLSGLSLAYCGLILVTRLLSQGGYMSADMAKYVDPYIYLSAAQAQFRAELLDGDETLPEPFMAAEINRYSPLSTEPYVLQMIDARVANNQARTEKLARHIIALNPRHQGAHTFMAEAAYLKGDAVTTLAALSHLIEFDPQNADRYLASMVALAPFPNGQETLLAALDDKPRWGVKLANLLVETVEDDQFIVAVLRAYPTSQSTYVRALWAKGERQRAHNLFLELQDDKKTSRAPFDPDFSQREGARPFNWRIARDVAEFETGGGLYITFFGSGRPTIAEQVVKLRSGAYTFSAEMRGETHRNGGHFQWRIECVGTNVLIHEQTVDELMASDTRFEGVFAVPQDSCTFQHVRLQGVAGLYPRTTRAEVLRVSIEDNELD